jgi:two-component system LytT family response regulator
MTSPIGVLIVDDEPLARSGLRRLCEQDPEIEVLGECADGRSAVAAIEQVEPDLLLLDIQMPGMDGFEVLRAVGPERAPETIFVTAYDRFALRAFEIHAVDYLLKPFSDGRFRDAIAQAKRTVREADRSELQARLLGLLDEMGLERRSETASMGDAADPDTGPLSRIVVKEKGSVFLVPVDEIEWIEAADYCAKLHVRGGVRVIRESLKSLERRLDAMQFFRVSRSAIVNLDYIREIQPFARGSQIVILRSGTLVTLSRSRREALARLLGQSL